MSTLRSHSFSAVILLLAVLAFIPTVALAQLPVTDDTFVTQTSGGNINYGSQGTLAVVAGGQPTYTYMKFNLSQVPAGSTVTKATLRLFVTAVATPGAFDVRMANGPWSESALTWITSPVQGRARSWLEAAAQLRFPRLPIPHIPCALPAAKSMATSSSTLLHRCRRGSRIPLPTMESF